MLNTKSNSLTSIRKSYQLYARTKSKMRIGRNTMTRSITRCVCQNTFFSERRDIATPCCTASVHVLRPIEENQPARGRPV